MKDFYEYIAQFDPKPDCPVCKGKGTYLEGGFPFTWLEVCGCITGQIPDDYDQEEKPN